MGCGGTASREERACQHSRYQLKAIKDYPRHARCLFTPKSRILCSAMMFSTAPSPNRLIFRHGDVKDGIDEAAHVNMSVVGNYQPGIDTQRPSFLANVDPSMLFCLGSGLLRVI